MARTTRRKRSQKNTNKRRIKRVRKSRRKFRGGSYFIGKTKRSDHKNKKVKSFFDTNGLDVELHGIKYESHENTNGNMIPDGTYYGQINQDEQRDGKGIMVYDNDSHSVYKGAWENGIPVNRIPDKIPLKLTILTNLNLIENTLSQNTGIFILILGDNESILCKQLKDDIDKCFIEYNKSKTNHNKNIGFGYVYDTMVIFPDAILKGEYFTVNKEKYVVNQFPTILKYTKPEKELKNADELILVKDIINSTKFNDFLENLLK